MGSSVGGRDLEIPLWQKRRPDMDLMSRHGQQCGRSRHGFDVATWATVWEVATWI